MLGFLKKKLSESVEKLSDRIKGKEEEQKTIEKPSEKPVEKAEAKEVPKKPEARPKKPEKKIKPRPAEKAEEKKIEEGLEEKPAGKAEKGGIEPVPAKKDFFSIFRKKPEIKPTEKEPEKIEEVKEEKKVGITDRLAGKVLERKISESDIDSLFDEMEMGFMEANVTLDTIDFLKTKMKEYLTGKQLKRGEIEKEIRTTLEKILLEIFDQGKIELEKIVRSKKPVCIVFLGFNGSGKTTSIAKLGKYLTNKKFRVVLAAGDTWRSAAIEQLEVHADRLGLNVIKHKYGADSAAVIYDAVEHAKAKGMDFVLADTAGRSHSNRNLMDELKKVVRVNKPDLKVLVMDSLAGNDLPEQARNFDAAVGVDCMIFTKVDVNEKGGGMLSACHAVKKPILYIGTGQEYGDIELFDAKKFVKDLMEG